MSAFLVLLLQLAPTPTEPAAFLGVAGLDATHPYYLFSTRPTDGCGECYVPLLLTTAPLAELSERAHESEGLLVKTYERDSLVGRVRQVLLDHSAIDTERRHVRLGGRDYHYQAAPPAEVLRLLENPEGTLPIHRTLDMVPPTPTDLEHLVSLYRRKATQQ